MNVQFVILFARSITVAERMRKLEFINNLREEESEDKTISLQTGKKVRRRSPSPSPRFRPGCVLKFQINLNWDSNTSIRLFRRCSSTVPALFQRFTECKSLFRCVCVFDDTDTTNRCCCCCLGRKCPHFCSALTCFESLLIATSFSLAQRDAKTSSLARHQFDFDEKGKFYCYWGFFSFIIYTFTSYLYRLIETGPSWFDC